MSDATIDNDALDFFRGSETVADPYPYFDWLRAQCPVHREPLHGVYMVTGYEEAFAVYADPDTFSSCNSVTGPFPGFPVPLEGREDVFGRLNVDGPARPPTVPGAHPGPERHRPDRTGRQGGDGASGRRLRGHLDRHGPIAQQPDHARALRHRRRR